MKSRQPPKDSLHSLLLGLSLDSSSSEETMMTPDGTMARGHGVRDHTSSVSGHCSGDYGGVEAMVSSSTSTNEQCTGKNERILG